MEVDLKFLDTNTKQSFQKVRDDIGTISKWINYFKESESSQKQQIYLLKKELTSLRSFVEEHLSEQSYSPKTHSEEESGFDQRKSSTDNLTPQQKQLMYIICSLYNEGREWISLQELSNELYPNREYSSVRTTLLEYTSLLEEFGLLKKKRKGKRLTVSLTKKGKELTKTFNKKSNIKVRKRYR